MSSNSSYPEQKRHDDQEYNKTEQRNRRAQRNIELLKAFKEGNLDSIKTYTGFGGLRQALKDESVQKELAEFLTPSEIEALVKSTSTGYFTPNLLADFIYQVLEKLNFTGGKILEAACGHGAFFARMPRSLRRNSDITGVELEPLSANIAKTLYPDIRVLSRSFQYFQERGFDLVIGNPPFAPFSVFDKEHPDLKDEMIHHYFVAKSARLLNENGLLAMIVPSYVLDNPKRHLRHKIAEVAELVTAYRFPSNLFEDAKITVDVVIFRRVKNPNTDWVESKLHKQENGEQFYLNGYFIEHPEHVLGELQTYESYSYFEDRPRRGLKCIGSLEQVQTRLPELLRKLSS